jgi:putative tryptophan/tyrosine transport system substrate-binding protein
VKRRTFLTLLGGAQQGARTRRIAVLWGGADDGGWRQQVAVFRQALEQLGWREGHNIETDTRWGDNDRDRIKALARDLVSLNPEVILVGPSNTVIQLQRETRTIPIVFVSVSDPIGQGIVESLARPTGNVTGFSNLEFSLIGKWLQILKEIAPGITRVAVMISIVNAASAEWYRMFDAVAPSLAIEPIAAPIRERADIERTIEALSRWPNGGLIVPGDTFVQAPPVRRFIVELTARHRLPALYTTPAFVADGGLMSYGIDQLDPYRRAAGYVDRILKGAKPADLPVQAPTKYELVINMKTARALGIDVPATVLARADEVIE